MRWRQPEDACLGWQRYSGGDLITPRTRIATVIGRRIGQAPTDRATALFDVAMWPRMPELAEGLEPRDG